MTVSTDVTAALELRDRFNDETGETDLGQRADLLKASPLAAERISYGSNCQLQGDRIIYLEEVDIGVAVDIDDGVDGAGFRHRRPATTRPPSPLAPQHHNSRSAGQADRSSNSVIFNDQPRHDGYPDFSAIINPPEKGILAVGAVQRRPVVQNDTELCIRNMMTMTLSVDHRVVDGPLAAAFVSGSNITWKTRRH